MGQGVTCLNVLPRSQEQAWGRRKRRGPFSPWVGAQVMGEQAWVNLMPIHLTPHAMTGLGSALNLKPR